MLNPALDHQKLQTAWRVDDRLRIENILQAQTAKKIATSA